MLEKQSPPPQGTDISDTDRPPEELAKEMTSLALEKKRAQKQAAKKRAAAAQARTGPAADPVYAPARQARRKSRHLGMMLSFVLLVLLPVSGAGYYLWEHAQDQYTSDLGFTVRSEEAPSAVDLLGGLSSLSNSSSSDSDILYEFIQSQEMVKRVDDQLGLHAMYSLHHDIDPLLSLPKDSSIEDLVRYWHRMVLISYAPGTGLIELKVKAFTPQDAQNIAQLIFTESSKMINQLSAIAREDAIRYAREELDQVVEQLKTARQNLTAFRSRTQIVDPSADIQLQMGLLNTLQQQLGNELINYDVLLINIQPNDPRLEQSEQRIAALRARIAQEREKFGSGGDAADGEDYATLVAEFERLTVEQEFVEQKYSGALKNYDIAQAEAQRQSRYLAAYLAPTLAESPQYPRRLLLLGLTALFSLMVWSTGCLLYYSLRDRR